MSLHYDKPVTENLFELRQRLAASFLEKAIRFHHFGYTIFGDKPLARCDIIDENNPKQASFSNDGSGYNPRNFPTLKEFHALEDSLQNIKAGNFILRYKSAGLSGCDSLIMVNLSAALKKIDANLDLFRDHLGDTLRSIDIVRAISNAGSIQEALCGRHDLAGILFGVGRESAIRFQRIMELKDPEKSLALRREIAREDIIPDAPYKTPQDELNDLSRNFSFLTDSSSSSQIIRPFNARVYAKDQESLDLISEYDTLRLKLEQAYREGLLSPAKIIEQLQN
jgi:hypothetical protein